MCKCLADVCILILCFIFPPLAVCIRVGCDIHLCINFMLTLFFFVPGIIHAIYCCFYMQTTVYRSTSYGMH